MVNYDQIVALPGYLSTDITKGYKFFPDVTKFRADTGYKIRRIPDIDVTYMFCHKGFIEEHSLKTIGDVLDLLNSWGYSEKIYSTIRYLGFRFNKTDWVWSHDHKNPTDLLVDTTDYGPISGSTNNSSVFVNEGSKTHCFADINFNSSPGQALFYIYYTTKQDLPDLGIPQFWTHQNSHKFVPDFVTKRDNDMSQMTFGVEIEVNTKLSKYDLQYLVTQVEPIQDPFFYFKHDGSISHGKGFPDTYEIVTMPCTYGYLRKNFKILFDKLEAKLPDWQSYFNVSDSCGVHVHINKDCFFSNLHLKKFVSIWNQFDPDNTQFIQKIGMRKFNKYCKIHQDQDGRTIARRLKLGAWGPGHDSKRYASCRETHHTTEVRVFKGGFTFDHIMYCLEAVHAMHQFSNKTPISLISTRRFVGEFTDWLNNETKYSRLKEHLKCA